MNAIWIDDDPARAPTARTIGARFVNLKDKELWGAIQREVLARRKPGLVVIDHVLNHAENPTGATGATLTERMKEKWPSCPVVGVSNADKLRRVDARTRRVYDALYSFIDFDNIKLRLPHIASGFASAARATSAQGLVKLLKPPKGAEIEQLLPDALKASPPNKAAPSLMFDWVGDLFARAGPLLDQISLATLIGLTVPGLNRVESRFIRAKYAGLFQRPDDPRWWQGAALSILYRECKPRPGEFSWQLGRRLPGLNRAHFSRCHACGRYYPETVAFRDEGRNVQVPAHIRHTKPDPESTRALYFEDVRIVDDGQL